MRKKGRETTVFATNINQIPPLKVFRETAIVVPHLNIHSLFEILIVVI